MLQKFVLKIYQQQTLQQDLDMQKEQQQVVSVKLNNTNKDERGL
jgi:hypothetical protein